MPARRPAHYAVLLAACGLLFFPNLGAHSFWDMDEGVNAGCAREMYEGGTWVVPTFNWELRTAKPVFLYWLQRLSFEALGPTEWSARLPSAILGMLTVLVLYELGRAMFGATTGLLAGLVLATATQFGVLSHAATPDAPLIFFVTLTMALFWRGQRDGRRDWFALPALAAGLATLSKGPVGLAIPAVAVLAYFAWNRELWRALDRRLIRGGLVWAVVALPWYILVTAETRGAYLAKFLGHDNVHRFAQPLEGHSGPPVYYLLVLCVLFAPWACFLGPTLWYAFTAARSDNPAVGDGERRSHRLLLCWFLGTFALFSAAATKLPNYIGPLYPALALLTARFLVRWAEGVVTPPRWVLGVAVGGVALTGLCCGVGLALAGGALPIPIPKMRIFPGLAPWSVIGVLPLMAAGLMVWRHRRGDRPGAVAGLTACTVAWAALLAAGPPVAIDPYKGAKGLVAESGAKQPGRDIRLAALGYFQESLVFYAERRVEKLFGPDAAAAFLAMPTPGYLFVPEKLWDEQLAGRVGGRARVAARRYDFYRNAVIVVVTNDEAGIGG